jgi:predicted nucleic acid-binding protein
MNVVVDASVAVNWFVAESKSRARQASTLLAGRYRRIAPDVAIAESLGALWRGVRRGDVTVDQGMQASTSVAGFFESLVMTDKVAGRAFRLAVDHQHPFYDCMYVALAESLGARLATFDERMKKLARSVGVRLMKMKSGSRAR